MTDSNTVEMHKATFLTPMPRPIDRLYTIGVKDGPTVLVAICADSTIWELDRRGGATAWARLPSIPPA